ncbi:MAG: hypothetical protein CMJ20_10215 [Phycisphaeraceae bacterium]|nr:hypothetical protein [Phycisphaeraceae bacterium]
MSCLHQPDITTHTSMNPSQILGHVQMDGWFVVKGVIPTDEIETVRIEAETVTAVRGASSPKRGL